MQMDPQKAIDADYEDLVGKIKQAVNLSSASAVPIKRQRLVESSPSNKSPTVMGMRGTRLIASVLLFMNSSAAVYFDCSGHSDGLYAIGCSSVFMRCYLGQTYNMTCPGDLKFNPDNAKCDYSVNVALCMNADVNKNKVVKAVEFSGPFDCSSRIDGVYGSGTCSTSYFSCYQGVATEMPCPPNLYYNSQTKGCDYKENIKECNLPTGMHGRSIRYGFESAHHEGEPLIHYEEEPLIPYHHHEFSCLNKPDGLFTSRHGECIDFFWLCAHGESFKFHCPAGLFFHRQTKQCDYQERVPECNGGHIVHIPPVTLPALPPISFECTGKTDGFYEIGKCQDVMVQCSRGYKLSQRCPTGLVFNKFSKACEYKHVCSSYSVTWQENEHYGGHERYEHGHHHHHQYHVDCTSKPDGQYAIGFCRSSFTLCSNGMAYERECPRGLVYSQWIGACDYHDNCKKWTHHHRPPLRPLYTGSTPSCLNLAQGAHALHSCSPNYFLCFANTASLASCPADLVFNPGNKQCDFPRNVHHCHGGPGPVIPQRPVLGPGPVIPPSNANPQPVSAVPEIDNFCLSKPNGLYTAGCENYFYSCNADKAYRLHCPQGLVFAIDGQKCDVRENVAECNPQGVPQSPAEGEQPKPPMGIPVPAQQPTTPAFDCTGKADGYYAQGCSANYFACTGGFANSFECPSNLKYDLDTQTCNYPERVTACGGTPSQPNPPQEPAQQPPQQTPAPPDDVTKKFCISRPDGVYADGCGARYFICASQTTFTYFCPQAFDCTGKADGYYAQGCSANYFACTGGFANSFECPSNLKYDLDTQTCNYPERVTACGGTPSQPNPPQEPAQQPPQQTPAPPDDVTKKFCISRPDGVYADGCGARYFICASQTTFTYFCPQGQVFNGRVASCDLPANVPQCPHHRY
ncbi:Chondroitin proteoglycan 2 [Toxocara canis]|uniref:Chondroitin proteoglycan 2 n=1 Tax=Toxocara canis TaxID=6265 RepID=A0A0B2V8F2_TOXCA|nr:Chondroitin proteoglycan 2 [Toxocara canis]